MFNALIKGGAAKSSFCPTTLLLMSYNIVHCTAFRPLYTLPRMRYRMSKLKNNQFSRILVPIDGSESSMKAADYAIAIARKTGENNSAELIALNVIHSEIRYIYMQNPAEGVIEAAKKEAQKWFDKVQEQAIKKGARLSREIIVDSRSVVGAIVDYAEHHNIDLIIIGSRGLSGFRKLLLGSTASGVVTYAPCPVLVVK
jgi:nucleotide-binding universal stress UspA family protein